MRNLLLIFVGLALWFASQTFAEDTNQIATNQMASGVESTNVSPRPSDAELQSAAREVLHKIVIFGIVALIGALVVAGFAIYGAYRKFGVRGVIVVSIILAFGVFVFGGFLLLF